MKLRVSFIEKEQKFCASFEELSNFFSSTFGELNDFFHVSFGEFAAVSSVYYDGDYEVDPSAHNDIILETRGLGMRDNVTVKKIYSALVSNPQGGKTFYIADN